jgi:hypothetical protein
MTIKNPEANFVERVHQLLGNIICTYELENFELNCNNPWSKILANCECAICLTGQSILNATPAQILLGRDMLFDLLSTNNNNELKSKTKSI